MDRIHVNELKKKLCELWRNCTACSLPKSICSLGSTSSRAADPYPYLGLSLDWELAYAVLLLIKINRSHGTRVNEMKDTYICNKKPKKSMQRLIKNHVEAVFLVHLHTYIYICGCVCVCMCDSWTATTWDLLYKCDTRSSDNDSDNY